MNKNSQHIPSRQWGILHNGTYLLQCCCNDTHFYAPQNLSLPINSWTIRQFDCPEKIRDSLLHIIKSIKTNLVDICNLPLLSSAAALRCHQIMPVTEEILLKAQSMRELSFLCVCAPLSISAHVNHFHSSPFPQFTCHRRYVPCLPTFLGFILHIPAPPLPHYLCLILSPFPFFSDCLQCIISSFTSSLSPAQYPLFHFDTQENPCCPMAMKHLSTSETSTPRGPPEIVLQTLLCKLFVLPPVSPKWQQVT